MKKIIIHLIGNIKQGTGHVYRMLRLTTACSSFTNQISKKYDKCEVLFVLHIKEKLAIKILKKNLVKFFTYDNNTQFYKLLSTVNSDIIINDCLNTDLNMIRKQRLYTKKIINFEDYGNGANEADLIINSFYNKEVLNGEKVKFGLKYTLLSPKLCNCEPSELKEIPRKLILSFGGSDPSNIIERVIKLLVDNNIHKKIHIFIVLGIGYEYKKKIIKYIDKFENISISIDEQNMIDKIQSSDIAITSCGCAMFECCFFLVPTICIAHHERELLHTKLCEENTIINMGLFKNLNGTLLIDNLNSLLTSTTQKKIIRKNLESIRCNIKNSYNNVYNLIFGN